MYFCEQTFLMKHTSEHTCETAIYHEQSPGMIKDKCNIQYYPIVLHFLVGISTDIQL